VVNTPGVTPGHWPPSRCHESPVSSRLRDPGAAARRTSPANGSFTTESNGVDPAKANLLDGWSSVEQPGDGTFLQLAFTRAAADGTTYLAFELNRTRGSGDNGRALVPCRRAGDVLVAFEAQGNRLDVVLQRWVTQPTGPRTGCARPPAGHSSPPGFRATHSPTSRVRRRV
jgi:hypothetical protein